MREPFGLDLGQAVGLGHLDHGLSALGQRGGAPGEHTQQFGFRARQVFNVDTQLLRRIARLLQRDGLLLHRLASGGCLRGRALVGALGLGLLGHGRRHGRCGHLVGFPQVDQRGACGVLLGDQSLQSRSVLSGSLAGVVVLGFERAQCVARFGVGPLAGDKFLSGA